MAKMGIDKSKIKIHKDSSSTTNQKVQKMLDQNMKTPVKPRLGTKKSSELFTPNKFNNSVVQAPQQSKNF